MRIKLVFDDWRRHGKSVYATSFGLELSAGDFHSGTAFDGEIELTPELEAELSAAIEAGFQPVFWVGTSN